MTRRKGDRAERDLANTLADDFGWHAQRTGSSGSATERPRPDVLACRRIGWNQTGVTASRAAAIEVKAWSDGVGHLDAHEIADLRAIAERSGARALVAVRPDLRTHDQWHVFDVDELHETPAGNFSVRKADLPGQTLVEVFG